MCKLLEFSILGSFTQFFWVSPMYTGGIPATKLVCFSLVFVFYYKGSLSQEPRLVKGK